MRKSLACGQLAVDFPRLFSQKDVDNIERLEKVNKMAIK